MFKGYEIKEKRCPMLVWEEDEINIELELSKTTEREVKEINDLVGFPPKGKVMTIQYFEKK